MIPTSSPNVVIYDMDTPEACEKAVTDLARRCNELPNGKKLFLRETMQGNPELEFETVSLLVLLLENSDDEYNITNPAVKQMLADAHVDLENM